MQTQHDTRWYRLLLAAALVAISYLAVTSRSIPGVRNVNDKIEHISAFFTLAFLVDFSWPKTGFRAPKLVTLFAYGCAIEIVQHFLVYRSSSLLDLAADVVGMLLYLFVLPLLKEMAPFNRRWTI